MGQEDLPYLVDRDLLPFHFLSHLVVYIIRVRLATPCFGRLTTPLIFYRSLGNNASPLSVEGYFSHYMGVRIWPSHALPPARKSLVILVYAPHSTVRLYHPNQCSISRRYCRLYCM